jgi:hypothetical protein
MASGLWECDGRLWSRVSFCGGLVRSGRVVIGSGGSAYYTPDHYYNFTQVRGPK